MHADDRTAREKSLRATAEGQFGLLRPEDLRAAGLGRGAIAARLKSQRLVRVHREVYALGHTVLVPEGKWLAALWAGGEGAALSHASAAAMLGLQDNRPGAPVHISTTRRVTTRPGLVVHRVKTLGRVDTFERGMLVATTIPRTLVDLADQLEWDEFRAVADRTPELHLARIRAAQKRAPGRKGAGLVTRLLDALDAHTKSEFERKYLRFCDFTSLARPDDLNVRVAGHKADCLYLDARLVIELDGREHHRREAQMRRDRQRDRNYQRHGYAILRFVWDDLHPSEARRTATEIQEMLDRAV